MKFTYVTYDGLKFEFTGKYSVPKIGDYFLSESGSILLFDGTWDMSRILRAIVVPIKRKYTFGSILFEETGEIRQAKEGEWYTSQTGDYMPSCCWLATGNVTYNDKCIILHPVEIT